jgi:hypothetical protein
MRGHSLEVELNSLDPRSFDNIQDFFTKFKSLLLHLKGFGVEKLTQHNQLILSTLSKLGRKYAMFVSMLHTVRFTSRATWKTRTLDQFIESLTHDKDKLIKMGTIKGPNVHALVMHERSNTFNPKTMQKGKGEVHFEHKKEGNSKPFDDSSNSKGGKGKKGKSKSGYCNCGYHKKSTCMKNTIDLMVKTLQQKNIKECIPENAKNNLGDQPPYKTSNSHALICIHSSPDAWILDSGTSHHMTTS